MADLILEIVEGEGAGRKTPLEGAIEVGRDASAGLSVDDEQASRRHARLSAQGDVAIVEDLDSTNGTYVNGQTVEGPRVVRPGDKVRVGLTVIEVRTAESVRIQPSAVIPVPQLTRVSNEVLEPVPRQALEPEPEPQPASSPPAFAVPETTPGFVPRDVSDDPQARADYAAVARLADQRVKRQTNVATFALLAAAGIAVLIVFGLDL